MILSGVGCQLRHSCPGINPLVARMRESHVRARVFDQFPPPTTSYFHFELFQTIMEQKVQVLVDNVADSASAVLNFASASDAHSHNSKDGRRRDSRGNSPVSEASGAGAGASCPSADEDAASRALTKDVSQLRRLVQAAITALRNAEIEDQQRTNVFATAAAATAAPPAPPAAEGQPGSVTPSPIGSTRPPSRQKLGRQDGAESRAGNVNVPAEGMDRSATKSPAPEQSPRGTTGNRTGVPLFIEKMVDAAR